MTAFPSQIDIPGSLSGSVLLKAPAIAGDTTFQLPSGNGTSGYVLQTDGAGATSWASPAAGTTVATAAQYRANTAELVLTTDEVWSAAGLVTLTDAATISVDMSTFINATVTLGGNRTLDNPTNTKVGQSGIILIKQDGTGSRTLAYGANWKFPSGTAPVLTTTASRTDKLMYFVESSTIIHAELSKDSR